MNGIRHILWNPILTGSLYEVRLEKKMDTAKPCLSTILGGLLEFCLYIFSSVGIGCCYLATSSKTWWILLTEVVTGSNIMSMLSWTSLRNPSSGETKWGWKPSEILTTCMLKSPLDLISLPMMPISTAFCRHKVKIPIWDKSCKISKKPEG